MRPNLWFFLPGVLLHLAGWALWFFEEWLDRAYRFNDPNSYHHWAALPLVFLVLTLLMGGIALAAFAFSREARR